jgi:predicted RNase H-like nuclease (RuvC/YqgF family)
MHHLQLKLQQDLGNTQDVALKLEAQNKEAKWAMQRMRADFKSQEETREQLAAETVRLRKDNEVLKETVLRLNAELEALDARQDGERRPTQQVRMTLPSGPLVTELKGKGRAGAQIAK